ncbi:MAG: 50S ribosomal protein L29 [Polyangiales bacterium]
MKAEDVRVKSDDELQSLLVDLQRGLWKARFQNHSGELKDNDSIRRTRRDIARIKTVLRQREMGAVQAVMVGDNHGG